jgi:hypothetical protein
MFACQSGCLFALGEKAEEALAENAEIAEKKTLYLGENQT